ncbi:DMT family transporter [Arsenophonus nasoniae]|uniref:DMT family transporter n=1 Tax=Arsenophonus nasoniae TaxID=638 RepID=D2U4C5_9GAMM|nr:DMT family transporter [Arsenophonus nasoniae]QBY44102.1 EamA-like transporter family protein [Arsenophonus nasoniae]WGL96403.1 DMT family transporter [Arsenophonus nasoniae]WGM04405.1 DMT family transporter [Arsenophonus nasoniae]WGM09509.1 DMT family transporter [Arsenophonus nasoniae]WGM14230.1 DMT family transporter [Arsenophonus nasoniae]
MKNFLFPLLAVLLWSINAVVSKAAANVIDPAAISFYRWLLAFLILTPFMIKGIIKNRTVLRQYGWKLFILGALGMVLYQSLAYYAAHTVSATFMGVLNSVIPLLTVILSIFVLRTIPTIGIVIGSLLSLMGLIWLVSQGEPMLFFSQGINRGQLLMFIAALSYSLYGVLTKHWAIPLPNWQSLYIQISFAVLLLLPNFLLAKTVAITAANINLILFAGIAASLIAPYLWIQGVFRLGANTTSIFMNLAPVFTAIIAVLFLKEKMHSYHLIGGGIVLLGVILAQQLRTPLTQLFNHHRSKANKKVE